MNQHDKALEYAINNYQLGMYMRGDGPYREENKYGPNHVNVASVLNALYRAYSQRPQLKEMAEKEIMKMFSENVDNCESALAYLDINAFDIEEGKDAFKLEIRVIYSEGKMYIKSWKEQLDCESYHITAFEGMEEDLRNLGYIE